MYAKFLKFDKPFEFSIPQEVNEPVYEKSISGLEGEEQISILTNSNCCKTNTEESHQSDSIFDKTKKNEGQIELDMKNFRQ